jgi:hypothetical protein
MEIQCRDVEVGDVVEGKDYTWTITKITDGRVYFNVYRKKREIFINLTPMRAVSGQKELGFLTQLK